MILLSRTRVREADPSGNPVLRYLSAPYIMLCCALIFLSVGIYQWLDPINHRYSGNLLILSYIPTAAGLFSIGMAVYFFTYRATLRKTAIEVSRWPFGTTQFILNNLESVERKNQSTVLRFAGGKKFVVHGIYSGRSHFLSVLNKRDGGY